MIHCRKNTDGKTRENTEKGAKKRNKGKVEAMETGENAEESSRLSKKVHKEQTTGSVRKDNSEAVKHRKSLEKLKDQDPEFYEFLQQEDSKLLDFDASDESDGHTNENSDVDEKADSDSSSDIVHKVPERLEVASDDSAVESSDEEKEDKNSKKTKRKSSAKLVTMAMINRWSKMMRENNSHHAVHCAVQAFKAAVAHVGKEEAEVSTTYTVEGSSIFNSIVRLCMTDILPTVNKILKLPKQKDPNKPVLPSSSKSWNKVRVDMKAYITDVIQMLSNVAEPAIQNVVLKHVHQLVPFSVTFPKIVKIMLKRLIEIWSTGDEAGRVLAFLSISKITRFLQSSLLEFVIKQMYMAYVKNAKFISPTALPNINFMQRSLVEMFSLDYHLSYQYAFVYIRQLAIHLRNAITSKKKKEACQAVYNWQYIHCLHLWVKMLSILHPNEVLEPLIYPLTQVIIGTIKLIPTARFYPLRFHCVRALNTLSDATGVFIPTLPLILEIFEISDFNKKHKSISMKPFNFAVILKLSKAQLEEKAFKDGIIDQMHELLMEQFHIHAHCIGFPELVVPAVIQMKQFIKKCKVANYTKQIKQISDKVEETSKAISQRRKTATLSLTDTKAIDAWEKRSKEEGTPLGKFYKSWRKLRDRELQHEISGKERFSHDDLPTINRKPRTATKEEKQEFADLFNSDSEQSDDDDTRFLLKSERPAKKQKTKSSQDESDSEDYSDFDEEELAQLAESADEEDSEEENSSGGEMEMNEEDEGSDVGQEKEEKNSNIETNSDSEMDQEDIVEDFEFSDEDDD